MQVLGCSLYLKKDFSGWGQRIKASVKWILTHVLNYCSYFSINLNHIPLVFCLRWTHANSMSYFCWLLPAFHTEIQLAESTGFFFIFLWGNSHWTMFKSAYKVSLVNDNFSYGKCCLPTEKHNKEFKTILLRKC